MASSATIIEAIKCSICRSTFICPRVLPDCGHTFCLECIKKTSRTNETSHRIICPECHKSSYVGPNCENAIPNSALEKMTKSFEKLNEIDQNWQGKSCPHVLLFSQNGATRCDHCNEKFCSPCLFIHKERIRVEIGFLSRNFDGRLAKAKRSLLNNKETIKGAIARNAETVRETVNEMCDSIEKSLQKTRKRLLFQVANSEQEQLAKIQRLSEVISSNNEPVFNEISALNSSSLLDVPIETLNASYQNSMRRDKEIREVEDLPARFAFKSEPPSFFLNMAEDVRHSVNSLGNCPVAWTRSCPLKFPSEIWRLHYFAKCGDLKRLKSSLDDLDDTAQLRFALEHCDSDDEGRNLLRQASERGFLEIVKYLYEKISPEIEADFSEFRHNQVAKVIFFAAARKQFKIVRYLVEQSRDFCELRDNKGRTLLGISARHGFTDLSRFLVKEVKCELNAKGNDGLTPLLLAVTYGYLEIVKILVENSPFEASEFLKKVSLGKNGANAAHLAAGHNRFEELVYVLGLDRSLVDEVTTFGQRTPLHFAVAKNHVEIARFLVEKTGADPFAKNSVGETALLYAALAGSGDCVRFLLDRFPNDLEQASCRNHRDRILIQNVAKCKDDNNKNLNSF